MTRLLVLACLAPLVFADPSAVAAAAAEKPEYARPELVREILAGTRTEARVSWWGFDAADSTEFLQQAIRSGARKLIIDRHPSPWVTRPLTGVSNQEIVFEEGAELVALEGAFRAKGDCLFSFNGCENVIIRGQKADRGRSARIRMHKRDYQSDAYEKSEWRHGLAFHSCRKVLVQDLAIEQTGGDGIYLGVSPGKGPNRNVVIRRVDCNGNHRQGISVISAEDLLIEDCLLRNTSGTAPQAGIDLEPNGPEDVLIQCVIRNCVAENNAGTGYQITPQFLNSRSRALSIYLVDSVSRGNSQHGIHLCTAPRDAPAGLLRIARFTSEEDGMAGLSVQFNPYNAVRVEMEDSLIRHSARKDTYFPPIYVQGVETEDRPAGNIHFKRVTVEDDVDRQVIRIRDGRGNGLKAMTGEIVLKRGGNTQTITLDRSWLSEYPRKD